METATAHDAWQKRIDRAKQLATIYPGSAGILAFYRCIAEFQKNLSDHLADSGFNQSECKFDTESFQHLLQEVQQCGPPALARAAQGLYDQGPQRWSVMLNNHWLHVQNVAAGDEKIAFLCRAFLEPFADQARRHMASFGSATAVNVCPFCGRKPVAAVLREEGTGGKRSLFCGFCSNEWDFRRLICPSCGEEQPEKLVVFRAEEFPQVRVDACENCKTYVKTIDLTKDGLAVPVVDELASLTLDIWTQEHGYSKLQANLLGI